ncbi:MAG TPA: CusA/CzcA family heavy metal efflux RND transporter, partial [Plasticicumulans sp.]|nr:CusA/CzcA family heavy metal efflux RND transporter [Plasticicumulans sp.]
MLGRIIAASARNLFLVLLGTAFVVAAGVWALAHTALDALPDLSDTQVIVYTEMPGQAPQVVEDQVTYPLTTALLGVPKSKVVRGFSFFGASFVYVIFEDGTDLYWARSRVLEYLNFAAGRLPKGITPSLGPDATGVGWVYQYVLLGAQRTLAELRTLQDWFVRYQLTKAQGVSEVASLGGFVQQYQVVVDPHKLQAWGIPLARVGEIIRASNTDVGGRSVELAETEYMVRGRGYLRGAADLENLVLKAEGGVPVLLRDVARVELGPDERRGIAELDGEGEAVGGIVVARSGANTLDVIDAVRAKLAELASGLPEGVRIEAVYDRSALIQRAIDTLRHTLIEESLVVGLVCIVFLWHVRSALVAILMLPVGVLIAFLVMHALGMNSNIMSLGGIAIAIGAMVDAAIVMIENAHKHLERAPPGMPRTDILIAAAREVGPPLFFSLLIITVSFLPVFTLEAQEGRLFKPLAYTKTFAMAGAALLSVTLVPALMVICIRGRIVPEHRNPLNRVLIRLYRPLIGLVLRHPRTTVVVALLALLASVLPANRLGSEFMPSLDEGTLLYMPTTLPGLSVTKAAELMQTQDRIIRSFPEVASVFGKAGRAATATDPAPLEMFETVINLKPHEQWRPGLSTDRLIAEMDAALQFPGVANAWTMPIKARIDMLSTGIRTPVGVKVFGRELDELERLARAVEAAVRSVPGTASAYAERITGGYYLTIDPDRGALARQGLTVGELQEVIATALGGETVTTAVEGRERFGVSVRYPRELR